MIKVVYFNQWFSSITDVIKDLKDKHKNSIKIIASSKNKEHAYKDVVDEFIVEDWEEVKGDIEKTKDNYIEWIKNTCRKYKVDIFFVKKHADWIAERSLEISMSSSVFVINESLEIQRAMQCKSNVYDILKNSISLDKYIPTYINTYNCNELLDLTKTLNKDNPWCFKLDCDEGGASFRKIDTSPITIDTLHSFRVNTVSSNEVKQMIKRCTTDELKRLIFMELLDSPEISVDCYNSKQGFIAICREKVVNTRTQRLYYNKEISTICEEIGKQLKLRFPYNVQFRVKHGEDSNKVENLRILEVNPRMSGGTYYSTLFDMNIANVCLCDMLNISSEYNIDKFIGFEDKYVSHVEKAITVEK